MSMITSQNFEMFFRSQASELADMQAIEQFKKTLADSEMGVGALVDFFKIENDLLNQVLKRFIPIWKNYCTYIVITLYLKQRLVVRRC